MILIVCSVDLIVCEDSDRVCRPRVNETVAGQKHCNSSSVADSTPGFVVEANSEEVISAEAEFERQALCRTFNLNLQVY